MFQVHATVVIMKDPAPEQRARLPKSVLGFIPITAYLGGGAALLAAQPVGLILAAAGGVVAIVSAILVSWIALVEVLR